MGDFRCDLCPKTYLRNNELIAHRKHSHATAPNYICLDCDEKFVMKRDLTTHRKTFHGLEARKCDICGKECFSKQSLTYHLKTHARPYNCELCQRSFEDKNRFAKHMHVSHAVETTETQSVATQSQFNHVSISQSSKNIKKMFNKNSSSSDLKHKLKTSHKFQPSPCRNQPSTKIICIEDTQNTTIHCVSNGDKFDDPTLDAMSYAPSPKCIKVGPTDFKESMSKKCESYSSCYSTDTEHDNETNTSMSFKDTKWLKVQKEACLDTEIETSVPYIDLSNLSPSADDQQIKLDGDEYNSDLKIQWDEQCNRCHITFTEPQSFSNHKASCCAAVVEQYSNNLEQFKKIESKDNHLEGMDSSQLIDLTEESTTDNSSDTSNEIVIEQVSLRGNSVENCNLKIFDSTSQEENGKQCTFCGNLFKDMSILQAHQEKCCMTLTTQHLSKNCEITYTCKICKAIFKDPLLYAVHEMKCTPNLGTVEVYTSQSEGSGTVKLDLYETPTNSSQADLLTKSETSSSFGSPISALSIDLTQDKLPTDQTSKNWCDQSLNQKKQSSLIVSEIQHTSTSNPEVFQCLHCTMKFQNHDKHHEHELSHELMANTPLGITYICIMCGDSFDTAHKIIQHVSIHEEPQDVAMLEKCSV